jgi:hypothetical protein
MPQFGASLTVVNNAPNIFIIQAIRFVFRVSATEKVKIVTLVLFNPSLTFAYKAWSLHFTVILIRLGTQKRKL